MAKAGACWSFCDKRERNHTLIEYIILCVFMYVLAMFFDFFYGKVCNYSPKEETKKSFFYNIYMRIYMKNIYIYEYICLRARD